MNKREVSVVIICRDAERTLERCLNSVCWADEIVLIDAESQDQTAAIAQNPKAAWASKLKWRVRPWTGFRDQRNFALAQARFDWILVIDADEASTPGLEKEVRRILAEPQPHRYYKVRRREFFLGTEITRGIWSPSYQDRFFHREGITYINEVHEYPPYPQTPLRIEAPIDHWPDFNVEQFLGKMNRYTTIEAKDRYDRGQRTHLIHLLFAFPAMVLKNYFYYRGYRDGFPGLIISLLEGISRAVRHIKLWQLERLDRLK